MAIAINKISFVVYGNPVAQERNRHANTKSGNIVNYLPEKTRGFQQLVKIYASQAMRGLNPFTEPCKISILFVFPALKGLKKVERAWLELGKLIPYVGRKDLDNLMKGCCDAMNGIVYDDDRLVVDAHLSKRMGLKPRIEIVIECLTKET